MDEKGKEVNKDEAKKLEELLKANKWKFILFAIIFLVLYLRKNNFQINIKEVIFFLPVIAVSLVICWLCDLGKIGFYKLPKHKLVKLFTFFLALLAGIFWGFEQFPLSGPWNTRRAVYGFVGVWVFYVVFRWILYPFVYHTVVFIVTGRTLEGYKDYMRKVKEKDEGKGSK